jgi:uncharacterized DUF497 family protein
VPIFEWDPDKATENEAKHGVTFEEAATAFADPLARIVDDPRHSVGEERFVLFGLSDRRRLLAVHVHRSRRAHTAHKRPPRYAPRAP